MELNITIKLDKGKEHGMPPMGMGIESEEENKHFEYGHGDTLKSPGWSGEFEEYLVKEGDTIDTVCREFDIEPIELAMLNKKEGNMISDSVNVGQKLLIPKMKQKPML